ncbi:deoxynucleoside triphosphate triphosphohydrolase SAMHD1-like [Liolophura sinensis]|uniref:deoxynucleoside triphosphate triphosphohydrolase SAMHD1-like n=1 Tax=Liolophura sinensis TaxID=3198878 RepID=UPI003158998E
MLKNNDKRTAKDDNAAYTDVDSTTPPPCAKRPRIDAWNVTIQPDNWTVEQMRNYLESCGLRDIGQVFKVQKISGDSISSITEKKLEEMGIHDMHTKWKTLAALEELEPCPALSPCKDSTLCKVFNDPIHGHIELHALCVKVIDTPQFQRLRYIKQLGGCYLVFPGASHNRFEHSIGTCYLAGEMTRALKMKQPELKITEEDILCVQLAGLCHDLGHGPFSHLFDQCFIPAVDPESPWEHEKASVAMFQYLLDDNGLKEVFNVYGLFDRDIEFIKELINGLPKQKEGEKDWPCLGRGRKKSFLYEIVANKRNGIDVDKWDYFARDCHNLGIRNSFDHDRFIKFARVIDVNGLQICSKDKEAGNLYEMFHTRKALHERAYQHPVNKVVESMITEALVLANDHIKFRGENGELKKMSEAVDDMVAFSKMTDSVFEQIRISEDPKLKKAQEIVRKIQTRQLYTCVGQSWPKPNFEVKRIDIPKILSELEEMVKDDCKSLDINMTKDDLHLHVVNLDYGMKKDNPIDRVHFYSKEKPNEAVKIRKEQVSMMLPNTFSEQIIRLYIKRHDGNLLKKTEVVSRLFSCFREWCSKNGMNEAKSGKLAVEMTSVKTKETANDQVTPWKGSEGHASKSVQGKCKAKQKILDKF